MNLKGYYSIFIPTFLPLCPNSNNEIFIQNALYDGEYKIDKIILEDISLEFEEIKLLSYNKIEQGV